MLREGRAWRDVQGHMQDKANMSSRAAHARCRNVTYQEYRVSSVLHGDLVPCGVELGLTAAHRETHTQSLLCTYVMICMRHSDICVCGAMRAMHVAVCMCVCVCVCICVRECDRHA